MKTTTFFRYIANGNYKSRTLQEVTRATIYGHAYARGLVIKGTVEWRPDSSYYNSQIKESIEVYVLNTGKRVYVI